MRVDFGMTLDAQSECGSASDAYRFNCAVLGHPFCDDTLAKLVYSLAMQRVHADRRASKDPGEYTVGHEPYIMAIGEHDFRITMKTAIFCARSTVVHAAWQVSHLRMERAAECDIQLLKATANPKQRYASVGARPYKG